MLSDGFRKKPQKYLWNAWEINQNLEEDALGFDLIHILVLKNN